MTTDVLVVGAGAAGLAAAKQLADSGCGVTVIEARERLGGRIWSHDPWHTGRRIDLGAEFIHDSPLARSFNRSGLLKIVATRRARWDGSRCRYVFGDHRIGRRERAHPLIRRVLDDDWYGKLKDAGGSVAGATGDWQPLLARTLALAEVQGLYAADAHDLNAKAVYDQWRCWEGEERQWWPRDVYHSLVERLARGLEGRVHKADAVTRIERRAGDRGVRVFTRKGRRLKAARAIVTIPLGVLQSSDVEFIPPLSPAKRDAIGRIGMGHVVKIAVRCRRPFWGKARFISSDGGIPVWWPLPTKPDGESVIIGWAGGPAAKALQGFDPEEIKVIALHSLRRLFPAAAAISRTDVYVVNWCRERFTLGAYSYDRFSRGGQLRRQLAEPEGDLLFFAGEATEPLYYGTVHGVLNSGRTAADLVLKSLRGNG